MKLLVINANTSETITAKVAEAARASASAGTEIEAVTARFGARIISSRSENAIAAHAALELAARHRRDHNAILIAVSLDTGVTALREMLSIPVVGMTEAAALVACTLGSRFGVVTLGTRTIPLYEELIIGYGLERRLAGVRAVDIETRDYDDIERIDEGVRKLAQALVAERGAEVIVLAGAAMAGRHRQLQGRVDVPLLDGITCGVQLAELLVRLGLSKPTRGSFSSPGAKELIDVDRSLIELFSKSSLSG